MKAAITAVFLALPFGALAGIPTETTLICPIGGEQFTITETLSCSENGARSMAFAPVSSCDFITRLPQCPQNRLPMYKDFSEAELDVLRNFMVSETYDSMVDRSRFYMAYIIERQLGGAASPFWLLLNGLWYDPENTFSDPDYLQEFLMEARAEIRQESEENQPYVQSISAFVAMKVGDFSAARALMQDADVENTPYLQAYHRAIEACLADSDSEFCNPQTLIPQP